MQSTLYIFLVFKYKKSNKEKNNWKVSLRQIKYYT